MANREAVFAVLEVLRKHYKSDGLTHNEIIEHLENDYNGEVAFKREKFAAIIKQINSSEDYEVVHTDGRYARYWLKPRHALTSTEVLLISALIADTDILSRLEADSIIDKLCTTFYTSFETEEIINTLKNNCRSNKNEITGIDKLEKILVAIKENKNISFQIYKDGVFSERMSLIPENWYMKKGDLIIEFSETEVKLSEMIDLI